MDLTSDFALQSTFKGVVGSEAVQMIESLQNGINSKDTAIEELNSENAMLRTQISRQKVMMEQQVHLREQLATAIEEATQQMAKEAARKREEEEKNDGSHGTDDGVDIVFGDFTQFLHSFWRINIIPRRC